MPGKYAIPISAALREAAELAQEFENSPLWNIDDVREGAITVQQQAERFTSGADADTQRDAAESAYEGYQNLSRALPDVYQGQMPDERSTGWGTAQNIAQLFGPEFIWSARVRLAFLPTAPDKELYNPDPAYIRGLIEISGLSQQAVAAKIGISPRMMRYYVISGSKPDVKSQPVTYVVQYAIERLAASAVDSQKAWS